MALSRRTLLYSSLLTAAGATLSWPLSGAAGTTVDLADLTSDTFLPHLNTRFGLFRGTKRVGTVTLVDVEVFMPPADAWAATASQDSFSLVFRGGRTLQLPQHTYTLTHAVLGTFRLLLVPVGRERVEYEAVFNRLRV
jgi:hypothetical protein